MNVVPHTREQWLGFLLLPLKAYTVIGPLLFVVSASLPRPRHTGATDVELYLVLALFPCSLILLLAAGVLTVVGPKDKALACSIFAVAALIIGYWLLPHLSNS